MARDIALAAAIGGASGVGCLFVAAFTVVTVNANRERRRKRPTNAPINTSGRRLKTVPR